MGKTKRPTVPIEFAPSMNTPSKRQFRRGAAAKSPGRIKIVAGLARGVFLDTPAGDGTRPTMARAREALFNSLASAMDFGGLAVLDLFAGSGALGLEAASRGAARVALVESGRQAAAIIDGNIVKLAKAGVNSEFRVIRGGVFPMPPELSRFPTNFDIIMADPPYSEGAAMLGRFLADAQYAAIATSSLLVWQLPPEAAELRLFQDITGDLWHDKNLRTFEGTSFLMARMRR